MKDDRLILLLDAFLDGTLSSDEKPELERMLLESESARREFWDRASLHGWTYAAAKLNYGAKPAAEAAGERRDWTGTLFERFINRLTHLSQFGWKALLTGGACAAAVMMWLGIRALQSPLADDDTADVVAAVPPAEANTNFVARLTRGTAIVWEGETNSLEVGSALTSRWLHLKSGAVQIEFYSGARVILEGPAALEVISPGEARLNYGKLSARVPEPAHGFKVYTPEMTVTDLGTEFGLNFQKAHPVKLEVFEGKVEMATTPEDRPQVLAAGAGVEVSAHKVQPMPDADRGDFMTAMELARREAAELRGRYQSWREAGRLLDTDAALLVHLNFEDEHNLDRNLVNRATSKRAAERAMIFGCDWASGRWPGKAALEFNSAEDQVRLLVPGEYQSLSFLSWVRVDSLPNRWNALALVNTLKAGETHWQIRRDGSVELSVRVDGGKAAWDHLVSAPIITQEFLGKWVQLGAVCDAQTGRMSLYFNGQLVALKYMVKKRALTLGNLELGNWTSADKKSDANYCLRDLHGRMDDFALLSRPLSSEEIRSQYDLGRPRQATTVAELK